MMSETKTKLRSHAEMILTKMIDRRNLILTLTKIQDQQIKELRDTVQELEEDVVMGSASAKIIDGKYVRIFIEEGGADGQEDMG